MVMNIVLVTVKGGQNLGIPKLLWKKLGSVTFQVKLPGVCIIVRRHVC